jgi:hypothetical protein
MASRIAPTGMLCEPVERKIGNSTVKLRHGDLTSLPVDAFVFYARGDFDGRGPRHWRGGRWSTGGE